MHTQNAGNSLSVVVDDDPPLPDGVIVVDDDPPLPDRVIVVDDDPPLPDGVIVVDDELDQDRKSTRLNSSHSAKSRMPSSA